MMLQQLNVMILLSDSDTWDSTTVLKRKADIWAQVHHFSVHHSHINILSEVC